MNPFNGELIKLEDPEFEKRFVVYGDDQVESRYVLSTSLMKRIEGLNLNTRIWTRQKKPHWIMAKQTDPNFIGFIVCKYCS